MSAPPNVVEVVGNYLDVDGVPVIATQLPPNDRNVLGGAATALGWIARWVKACTDEVAEVFLDGEGLQWGHGRWRHNLKPGHWVIWDGHRFLVVGHAEFKADYEPVTYVVTPSASTDEKGQS